VRSGDEGGSPPNRPYTVGVLACMKRRYLTLMASAAIATSLGCAGETAAQGIVTDQGQFQIWVRGVEAGTEDFVIRRAGLGSGDAVFANGTVRLAIGGAVQEMSPLLRATPPDGAANSYQITVSGEGAVQIHVARSGRRFVATIRSQAGDEDREFQARPDTRVLELDVAHQYYFLRDVRPGREIHVLEPRSRRQLTLLAESRENEELKLGPNVVTARRMTFRSNGDDDRVVWFDRQGRVLRVEIPSRGYVAERTDLVG
jgi:hypothetical protein